MVLSYILFLSFNLLVGHITADSAKVDFDVNDDSEAWKEDFPFQPPFKSKAVINPQGHLDAHWKFVARTVPKRQEGIERRHQLSLPFSPLFLSLMNDVWSPTDLTALGRKGWFTKKFGGFAQKTRLRNDDETDFDENVNVTDGFGQKDDIKDFGVLDFEINVPPSSSAEIETNLQRFLLKRLFSPRTKFERLDLDASPRHLHDPMAKLPRWIFRDNDNIQDKEPMQYKSYPIPHYRHHLPHHRHQTRRQQQQKQKTQKQKQHEQQQQEQQQEQQQQQQQQERQQQTQFGQQLFQIYRQEPQPKTQEQRPDQVLVDEKRQQQNARSNDDQMDKALRTTNSQPSGPSHDTQSSPSQIKPEFGQSSDNDDQSNESTASSQSIISTDENQNDESEEKNTMYQQKAAKMSGEEQTIETSMGKPGLERETTSMSDIHRPMEMKKHDLEFVNKLNFSPEPINKRPFSASVSTNNVKIDHKSMPEISFISWPEKFTVANNQKTQMAVTDLENLTPGNKSKMEPRDDTHLVSYRHVFDNDAKTTAMKTGRSDTGVKSNKTKRLRRRETGGTKQNKTQDNSSFPTSRGLAPIKHREIFHHSANKDLLKLMDDKATRAEKRKNEMKAHTTVATSVNSHKHPPLAHSGDEPLSEGRSMVTKGKKTQHDEENDRNRGTTHRKWFGVFSFDEPPASNKSSRSMAPRQESRERKRFHIHQGAVGLVILGLMVFIVLTVACTVSCASASNNGLRRVNSRTALYAPNTYYDDRIQQRNFAFLDT